MAENSEIMDKCPECGSAVEVGVKFCHQCGARLHPVDETAHPYQLKAAAIKRFTASDARNAIIGGEIISPPLSKRRR